MRRLEQNLDEDVEWLCTMYQFVKIRKSYVCLQATADATPFAFIHMQSEHQGLEAANTEGIEKILMGKTLKKLS